MMTIRTVSIWFFVAMSFSIAGAASAATSLDPASLDPASLDPLDAPSTLSFRAQSLLMGAVTKAGDRLVSVGERGTIMVSDDQGATWRQVPTPVRVTLTAVAFPTPKLGWAVGHSGVVLATTDGGETWVRQLDGITAAKIELAQAQAALTADPNDPKRQRRVREAQGLVSDGPDKPFMDVMFSDADHGMIVGAYGLAFVTADGGHSWTSLMGQMDNASGRNLYAICQAAGGLYVVGEQASLFQSNDGGQNFHQIKSPGKGTFFGAVASTSGDLIVFGLRGALYRSPDAGATWMKIDRPPSSLTGGKRLSDGSIVLVDEDGHLLRSTDNGASFQGIPLQAAGAFSGIAELDPHHLILAGAGGNRRVMLPSTEDMAK